MDTCVITCKLFGREYVVAVETVCKVIVRQVRSKDGSETRQEQNGNNAIPRQHDLIVEAVELHML
jgi:hypothetical protein